MVSDLLVLVCVTHAEGVSKVEEEEEELALLLGGFGRHNQIRDVCAGWCGCVVRFVSTTLHFVALYSRGRVDL